MVMPLQYSTYKQEHPCNGVEFTVWHEYWNDQSEGRFWTTT